MSVHQYNKADKNGDYVSNQGQAEAREGDGNVCDKGIVSVATSSVLKSSDLVTKAVDLGIGSRYASRDEPRPNDFKERCVISKSSSVKWYYSEPKGSHTKSWVVEVSNDESSWTAIDR